MVYFLSQIISFINTCQVLEPMEEKQLTCSSCKKRITNSTGTTTFQCPSCGKAEITRCKHCREIATKYTCPNCGFTGPN